MKEEKNSATQVYLRSMLFSSSLLQFANNPLDLLEWFIASVVLVVVVTLVYVFGLSKSPPPEGMTIAKSEQQQIQQSLDPRTFLNQAEAALRNNNPVSALEGSVESARASLRRLIEKSVASFSPVNLTGMNISDLAYLVQSRLKSGPQITEPCYQLNNLRLRLAQGQPIDPQQASWAVSFAAWLVQAVESDQFKF